MHTAGTKCRIHPPKLNSCIVPNACKKVKIVKIKVKLNVYFPEDTRLPPK